MKRSELCKQQAADCAASANATSFPEVREAYRSLEEGWKLLIPEITDNAAVAVSSADANKLSKSRHDKQSVRLARRSDHMTRG